MELTGYKPMTLVELSQHLSVHDNHETRWRLVLEFLEEFSHETTNRAALLSEEPRDCGDPHWNLVIAAVAEHLAWHNNYPIPPWTEKQEWLWAGSIWYLDSLPSARVWAMAYSPAAFRRRGIFLLPEDLARS